jgi:hypothetical protein
MTIPTITELRESLLTQPYHACCSNAKYLRPPTRGTGDQFVDVRPYGQVMIGARSEWIFDLGDGEQAPPVRFCPFCGEQLNKEEAQ